MPYTDVNQYVAQPWAVTRTTPPTPTGSSAFKMDRASPIPHHGPEEMVRRSLSGTNEGVTQDHFVEDAAASASFIVRVTGRAGKAS